MRGSGRLEIDVLDAGCRQRIAELFYTRPFDRTCGEKQDLDLAIERGRIRKGSAADRFYVE